MHCLVKHKTVKSCSCTKRYCVSKMKLLMSGDIELNPGPEQNVCDQTALSVGSTLLLNYRLGQLGLRPLDNFLYFSFTTSCLEIKLCSIHCIFCIFFASLQRVRTKNPFHCSLLKMVWHLLLRAPFKSPISSKLPHKQK